MYSLNYEAQKTQNGRVFCLKLHFTWRTSATKFLCVHVSDKGVRHSLAYLTVQNMVGDGHPLLPEMLAYTDPPPSKRRFPIDIHSLYLSRNT